MFDLKVCKLKTEKDMIKFNCVKDKLSNKRILKIYKWVFNHCCLICSEEFFMSVRKFDVVIVGGGASGLFSAVILGRMLKDKNVSIAILEKAQRVGRKLIATGNGTCNITNVNCSPQRYHGEDPQFVKNVIEKFTPTMACKVFSSIGVECYTREDGKVYPLSLQASSVLDCLRMEAKAYGVEEICNCAVLAIKKTKSKFIIQTQMSEFEAQYVLICTGGAASQSLGGCCDGYSLLTDLGHTKTPLFPSIVQIKTDTEYVKSLKGIRINGKVSFLKNDNEVATESGEILFTEYGISGPAVMQISRCVGEWERKKKEKMYVKLDLMEKFNLDELTDILLKRKNISERLLEDFLTGFLNKRLGQTLIKASGLGPLSKSSETLDKQALKKLSNMIKGWKLEVYGTQGLSGAQVTAGGILTSDFDCSTMMSKKIPCLYAAGEVLDVDGDCGGFNLQWAWSSSYAMCKDIVQRIEGIKEVDFYSRLIKYI